MSVRNARTVGVWKWMARVVDVAAKITSALGSNVRTVGVFTVLGGVVCLVWIGDVVFIEGYFC